MQQQSDLLVMISHTGLKGIPSSKLYEYVGLKKPILLYPNDEDIIESVLKDSGLGIICDSEKEIIESLTKILLLKQQGSPLLKNLSDSTVNKYSRKEQTAILAKALKGIHN